jgi:hypothetical protein
MSSTWKHDGLVVVFDSGEVVFSHDEFKLPQPKFDDLTDWLARLSGESRGKASQFLAFHDIGSA